MIIMRKSVYPICEQRRRRSACASAKSADQRLFFVHCLDIIISLLAIAEISRLASLWSWAGRFESYLVKNPEDRFSRDEAQIGDQEVVKLCLIMKQYTYWNLTFGLKEARKEPRPSASRNRIYIGESLCKWYKWAMFNLNQKQTTYWQNATYNQYILANCYNHGIKQISANSQICLNQKQNIYWQTALIMASIRVQEGANFCLNLETINIHIAEQL